MSIKHYISKNVANLHVIPKEVSEVATQAIYATEIKILKEQNNWFFIQTPDKYQGWILKDFVISKKSSYLKTQASIRVKSLWAHVHLVEDTTPYPPIITLPFETKIEIISTKEEFLNRWIKVRLIDGKEGFAQSRDFDFNPKILSLSEMIAFSKSFINIPYYWGGNSSFGYDCSGFTQMLYRQMGINIYKDSFDQAKDPNLKDVEFKDLQIGDLVFFSSNKKKITHVGMYLEDSKIIHAGTKNVQPKIQITKISSSNTNDGINIKSFVTARRKKT